MAMNCDHVLHHVDAYVRGEIDPRTSAQIEEHIRACDKCRKEETAARRIASGLRAMSAKATMALERSVLASASAARASRGSVGWFTPARALAACFVVGFVIFFTSRGVDMTAPIPLKEEPIINGDAVPVPEIQEKILVEPVQPAMEEPVSEVDAEPTTSSRISDAERSEVAPAPAATTSMLREERTLGGGASGVTARASDRAVAPAATIAPTALSREAMEDISGAPSSPSLSSPSQPTGQLATPIARPAVPAAAPVAAPSRAHGLSFAIDEDRAPAVAEEAFAEDKFKSRSISSSGGTVAAAAPRSIFGSAVDTMVVITSYESAPREEHRASSERSRPAFRLYHTGSSSDRNAIAEESFPSISSFTSRSRESSRTSELGALRYRVMPSFTDVASAIRRDSGTAQSDSPGK